MVSLEIRASAVTEQADVVLPVAPVAEKAGRFVTWEGRRRPFDLTITSTGAISDGRALHALAEELDVALGMPTVEAARDELLRLGIGECSSGRCRPPSRPAPRPAAGAGQAVLATWAELIDAGRMQDGDENLAGTAKPVRARAAARRPRPRSASAAGATVRVGTDRGGLELPVEIGQLPDRVVWVPTNARGAAVRATLGVGAGAVVSLTSGGAA